MALVLGNTTFYSPGEVATVIDRHYETALGRIKEGAIPAQKINNGYLVSHDDLVQYLDEELSLPETTIELRLEKKAIADVSSTSSNLQHS